MPTITDPDNFVLMSGMRRDPVCWLEHVNAAALEQISKIDLSDAALERFIGRGKAMKLKSFGHDDDGIHFLVTRAGTTVHTDTTYIRYSHQLVLRNDGNRLRGLPKYDDPAKWHEPLIPGVLYALDTHSPHQGLADPRFNNRGDGVKAVLAMDRSELLDFETAFKALSTWLDKPMQLTDVSFDPARKGASPRWKEPT